MKILETFDEYTGIVKEVKSVCRRPFSNIFYMSDEIKKYIESGRLAYERTEGGIIFFEDEKLYYRVCLYVNEQEKFMIYPQNKKILIRNIYKTKEKGESLQRVEQRLGELGFQKKGTTIGIQGEPLKIFQRCDQIGKYAKALEKKGYRCLEADFSKFREIEAMILDSGIIQDYQLDYRTDDEKRRLERGSYLYMVDGDGQICAASLCFIEGGIAKVDGVAVKEKYKTRGLAPCLTYHRFKWMHDKGVRLVQGWILTNNVPSLRYHRSLGYEFMDKYADEWILEAR